MERFRHVNHFLNIICQAYLIHASKLHWLRKHIIGATCVHISDKVYADIVASLGGVEAAQSIQRTSQKRRQSVTTKIQPSLISGCIEEEEEQSFLGFMESDLPWLELCHTHSGCHPRVVCLNFIVKSQAYSTHLLLSFVTDRFYRISPQSLPRITMQKPSR